MALVTGAARGIGEAVARLLAREGAKVIMTDVDPAGAEVAEAIRASGASAEFALLDVTAEADWERVFALSSLRSAPLDILVNNAGVYFHCALEETSVADIQRVISVNLMGMVLGTRCAMRAMKSRVRSFSASVVNVSSIAGLVGAPMASIYGLSKGGVRSFTKAAALEFAALGYAIRCNSIHPGLIRTDMTAQVIDRMHSLGLSDEAAQGALLMQYPMGRLGEAEEIAKGVLFLASDDSSFMTGAELVLDGGYTAR